jgi:putative solute:sodium symporter small subunit
VAEQAPPLAFFLSMLADARVRQSNKNNRICMNDPSGRGAQYWRANIRLLCVLLSIWFLCSFGLGILWADWLDQFRLFGFKLGFWFSQQGSIYVFVVLIFIYVFAANRLDHRYGVDEDNDQYVEDEEYYHPDGEE